MSDVVVYTLEGNDGKIYKIEGPSGLSISDLSSFIEQQKQPAVTKAGKTLNETLAEIPRQVGLTARYGLEGLADALQVGTEPIANLMRMAGVPTKSTRQVATTIADSLGLPTPQNATERVVGDATRLMAGAGGGAGLASRLSAPVSQAMQFVAKDTAPVAQSVGQKVGQALAAKPIEQISSAAGAGLAGGASREAGGNEFAQTAAAVVGGIGGALAPGGVQSVVQASKAALRPKLTPQELDKQLTNIMEQAGADFGALSSAAKAAMRNELRSALQAGKELDPKAVARFADFATVRGATPTRGMVTQDPVQITREMNLAKIGANSNDTQLQGLAQIQNKNNAALISALNDAGASNGDVFRAGESVVNTIKGSDAAMGREVSSLYRTARDMPGGDVPLERTRVVNAIYDALSKENKLAYLPDDIANTINTISQGQITRNGQTFNVPFNVNVLDNLMTDLATAQRGAKDGNVKAALKIARQAIDSVEIAPLKAEVGGSQMVTQAAAGAMRNADGQAASFLDALNKARDAARSRFSWQESAKPIEAVLDGAEPDNIIQRFVIGGSVKDAQAIAKEVPVGEVKQAILAHLKDKALSSQSDEIGKFSPANYNKALKAIGDRKLELFFSPEELVQLRSIGRVASYMQNQPVGSAVNNSNSGALVLGRGGDLLESLLRKIPLGGVALADPLRSINISLTQRQAENVLPGLLAKQPGQPIVAPLLLPGAAISGGLLSQ